MQHKSIAMLVVMVLLISTATSAFAGNVRISGSVNFGLGPPSLFANGTLSGLGQQDVNLLLDASGVAVGTCINQGGNELPGLYSSEVWATGKVLLSENGQNPFSVEAAPPGLLTGEDAVQFGCPNANSTARVDFVFWTNATISVVDAKTGTFLIHQPFICVTTGYPNPSVSCTPIP